MVSHLRLSDEFIDEQAIWTALTTLHGPDGSPMDTFIMELLGAAFYTLWLCHWRSVIDHQLWQNGLVFSSFLADNASLISSYLDK